MSTPHRMFRAATVLALAGLPLAAQADPIFRTLCEKPGQNVGLVIASGDFTGDGLPDVALVQNGKLRILTGNGDGSVASVPLIEISGVTLDGLVAGDLNGDGRLDLVSGGGPKVQVTLATGPGTFAPPVTYAGTDDVNELRLADLDGDGALDLIASNDIGPRVSVYLGAGDGTLLPRTDFGPTGSRPNSVATGDLDADGDIDLVFGNYFEDFLSVFLNDGTGAFGAPLSVTTAENPQAVALADFDEDGLPDLAVTAGGDVQVFQGNGDGSFEPLLATDVGAFNPGLQVGDFDEDGHLDLVATTGGATITVLRGHGDLSFDAPAAFGGGASAYELALADLDLDGELDIAATDFAFDGLTVLLGRGDASFGPHLHVGGTPRAVALLDLNGDGRLDAVTSNSTGISLSVTLNEGNGVFGPVSQVTTLFNPGHLATGDFTGDGRPDIAVHSTGSGGGQVKLHASAGNGTLHAGPPITVFNDLNDIAAADFDGDGALDLVTADGGFDHAAILYGHGNGTFEPPSVVPTGINCSAVAAADFDGDGAVDLAEASSLLGGGVQVHLNLGNRSFAEPIPMDTTFYSVGQGLSAGDLDGDGAPDLVSCGSGSGRCAVFLNHGDGSFEPPAFSMAINNPVDTALGDVDDDGDTDIVLAQEQLFLSGGTVGVLLNDGTGHFAPQEQYPLMADVSAVALGDVNGDGVVDVAAAVSGADTLSILTSRRGPWDDLLHPLAGTHGFCHQTGEGSLAAGQPFRFTLSDALPGGAAYHFVGLAALNAPFKGGLLVPTPTLINGPLPVDGAGKLVLAGPWPGGVPSGLQLWFQFWFHDAGGPAGFAASNALRATMP